jgi:hypothetical protein
MTLWKGEFFLPYNFFFFLGGGTQCLQWTLCRSSLFVNQLAATFNFAFEFLGTAVDLGYCLKSLQSSFKIIDILSNIHFPFRF